jgi:hypothetical protein
MTALSTAPRQIPMAAPPVCLLKEAPKKSKDPRFIDYLQRLEALGEVNRYYFHEKHGREPSIEEAIEHYRQNGGPEAFLQAHPELR